MFYNISYPICNYAEFCIFAIHYMQTKLTIMKNLNEIIDRSDNVNFTTVKTSGEAANSITRFDSLVNLSKFCLASQPERADAVQTIKYALNNYSCTKAQQIILEKIIDILMVTPNGETENWHGL